MGGGHIGRRVLVLKTLVAEPVFIRKDASFLGGTTGRDIYKEKIGGLNSLA